MTSSPSNFGQQKRVRDNLLPPAAKVVSEGFIEIVFFLLGIGILLPWNAYISAKQYFVSRICEQDPILARHIELWFSILYSGASVLSLAVVILVQYATDTDSNSNKRDEKIPNSLFQSTRNLSIPMMSSKTLRIDTTRASTSDAYTWYMVMVPLGLYLAVFFITTIFVFIDSIQPRVFAILTLSGLFICGVCTAVASSGIVGTAGLFDPNVGVNPYFNGQAAGGLLVACANFFASVLDGSKKYLLQYCSHNPLMNEQDTTIDVNEDENEDSKFCLRYSEISWATAGYFSMSCIILAACMVGYSYVDQYKHLVRKNSLVVDTHHGDNEYDVGLASDDEGDEDMEGDALFADHVQYLRTDNVPQHELQQTQGQRRVSKWKRKALVNLASYQNRSARSSLDHSNLAPLRRSSECSEESVTLTVWRSVHGPAMSLFWTYFCTLVS
jgi:hypothetical protein